MTKLTDALSGLLSLSGIIAFLLGAASVRAYYWLKCRKWNRQHPDQKRKMEFKPLIMLWAMIFIIMGYYGMQQQQQGEELRDLTKSTADCQVQFNTALRARAKISEDNDRWSYVQRKALGDWLHDILLPPPDIQKLRFENPNDPRITQWGLDVTRYFNNIIQQAQVEQDQNMKERQEHPLPEPTCGKPSK